MKRLLSLTLSLVLTLLLLIPAGAAESQDTWRRSEGDGRYVTLRVPYAAGEDLSWSEYRYLCLRYGDTGEPVSLVSDYWDGALFATVPAEDAERPLEVVRGERFAWTDFPRGTEAMCANTLYLRGILRGDAAGNFAPRAPLTRGQAAVLFARLLALPQPEGETVFSDVPADSWCAGAVNALHQAGLLPEASAFRPDEAITRAEFTAALYDAFSLLGWAKQVPGTAADLDFLDAEDIPAWVVEAYLILDARGLVPRTPEELPEEAFTGDELPIQRYYAQPDHPMTREEGCELLDWAMRRLPWYPSQTAVEWGFDEAMPVIDGSTSTYPFTTALYGSLFENYTQHPQLPAAHSTSYDSYENLIDGKVDVLFAAAKASSEQTERAKARGVTLEYVPIARDAMVFFTNVENSVEGLTRQQIQDIYVRNTYQNWKDVGGSDAALLPYCRNIDSGSHSLMERYFLDGGALSLHPGILQGNVSQAMSSALTDVAAALKTDPPAYALGYSVYYYYLTASTMMGDVTDNQIKLLAVDGVTPSDETIADGTYPLADYNYLVLRSDEPQNSPARRLAEFMRTQAGQTVVESAGFGRVN